MKNRLMLVLLGLLAVAPAFADESVQTRVSVTSQPSGATVIIDGQDRGTTPVTLFDLAPGLHHLKYRLAGYMDRDRFFDTKEGPFIEKNDVLREIKGLLLLKTDPEGADISIDGRSVGRTPRLVTDLAVKDAYTVRFRKAGYQDHTITVKFDGRTPLVGVEALVLASGTIDVMSEPAGAEVMVNGISRGKTPVKVTGVPRGRAVVKFTLDGFAEEVRELSINAGDVQTLPVILKGLPGTLQLTSVPDGARFYVNDVMRGKSPLVLPGLKPGEYAVRAELEGYGTMTRTVVIENGSSANEEFRMSNTMGRIEVRTDPVGATLLLDGHIVGTTKAADPKAEISDAFAIENVLEGEHTLVVRKDGYTEVTRHPKVATTKTTITNVRMRRIFIPDVEIVTARGSYRGVLVENTQKGVVVEVSLGITRSFPKEEIRQINLLTPEK